MSKCLICTGPTNDASTYHESCVVSLFETKKPPVLETRLSELNKLAKKSVTKRITVPGVQTKLSLEVKKTAGETDKLTIVGLWGRYILKPPSNTWPQLPENEHCTMLMAQTAGIETVPFGLIKLASGERAFITKRIDRDEKGNKYAMEDMCQLTERMTEDKYKGSHEQISKIIKRYSANPFYDITRFFEVIVFSYLTGNGDMHLKNFSLFRDPDVGWKLSPAYDLLSTRLVLPASKDPEDLSLTISGKKSNFNRKSFTDFGKSIGMNQKQIENIFKKLKNEHPAMKSIITNSFLSNEMKENYRDLLDERFELLVQEQ